METILDLGSMSVDVIRKNIKNLHLSVHPPTGRVRIAAPEHVGIDVIRAFAISHLAWIKRNQRKIIMQEREPAREYVDRESHFVWGERVMLRVIEHDATPSITQQHRTLIMEVRPGMASADRQRMMDRWYRQEVRRAASPIISKWEQQLRVAARQVFVQRMKTKWGSCNPVKGNIRLNTELAKKPLECLDYVVLHELAHLREPTHSSSFFDILDLAMPQWQDIRRRLNALPLSSDQSTDPL